MRRISILPLTIGSLFALACMCGGGDEGFQTDPYEGTEDLEWDVGLTEPWSSMGLPVSDGMVFLSEPTQLMVSFEGARVTEITSDWAGSIQSSGWSLVEDMGTPEFTARVYSKGDDAMALGVGAEEGMTFAYLELMAGLGSEADVEKAATTVTPRTGDGPRFLRDDSIGGPAKRRGKFGKVKGAKSKRSQ